MSDANNKFALARAVNRLAVAVEKLAGAEPAAQPRPALRIRSAAEAGFGGGEDAPR